MSQQTSAAIAAIQSATIANSITPTVLAQVLTLLLGDVDNGDDALNTLISSLSSYVQNVENTVNSQGTDINNLNSSLQQAQYDITANSNRLDNHDSSLTTLSQSISGCYNALQPINQRTTLLTNPYTGKETTFLRESDCMPFLTNKIDCVKYSHPRMMTRIKDGNSMSVDLTSIAHEQVQILIECDSDCDLSPYMQHYNIKTRSGADFRLHHGNSYVLYLNRVIDVEQNSQYSTQYVEIYATLIKQ